MEINKDYRGILEVNDGRIIFRNFSGEASKFNKKGDRNFALIIPDEELANALVNDGWNVKIRPPREEGEEPFMYLPVKVKFSTYGPNIYLQNGDDVRSATKLTEGIVDILDSVDIMYCDMDIRPYDWEVNGKTGRTAYLQSMTVAQRVDRISQRYFENLALEPGDDLAGLEEDF